MVVVDITTAVAGTMAVVDTTAPLVIMAEVDTITPHAVMAAAYTIRPGAVIMRTAGMDITTRTLAASGTAIGMRTVSAPAGAGRITMTSTSGSAAKHPRRLANNTKLSKAAMLNRGLLFFEHGRCSVQSKLDGKLTDYLYALPEAPLRPSATSPSRRDTLAFPKSGEMATTTN